MINYVSEKAPMASKKFIYFVEQDKNNKNKLSIKIGINQSV